MSYLLTSYSRKSDGLTISIPSKRFSTSKSLSPVMMQAQFPAINTLVSSTTFTIRGQTHLGQYKCPELVPWRSYVRAAA